MKSTIEVLKQGATDIKSDLDRLQKETNESKKKEMMTSISQKRRVLESMVEKEEVKKITANKLVALRKEITKAN
ncbi:hypothetical protein H6770_04135 [Candidatus Peribacteria bacterium]|nr:hypothetical protein [Candidatus Peribacteria bacterium]